MFTVKVINKDKSEWLYATKAVTMRRGPHEEGLPLPGLNLHGVYGDDGATVNISAEGTTAFVMNDGGATVARYDF